jgi:inosine/xanthosine triphosphate pyrophosphatase family protein
MDWVLASNNAHKIEEIGRVMAAHGVTLRPLRDFPQVIDPPEDQDTFEGNALQ